MVLDGTIKYQFLYLLTKDPSIYPPPPHEYRYTRHDKNTPNFGPITTYNPPLAQQQVATLLVVILYGLLSQKFLVFAHWVGWGKKKKKKNIYQIL
jgi:hypothetical protein